MKGSHLKNISAEERAEMVQKAAEKRQSKKEFAEKNLKLDWADDTLWRSLASKYDYRLPQKYEPASSKFVNRFLKKFGLDKEWYIDHTGFKNGNDEARMNPNMPAYAQIGFLLEVYDNDESESIEKGEK